MNKRNRKLLLYAASGFGPNLLMILVTAYFIDAVYVEGLGVNTVNAWSITGTTVVIATLFGVLWTIAKIIDGIIDIPLSNLLENMNSKWGKRKLAILIGFIPMVIAYIMLWVQPFINNPTANTWWIFIFVLIFFIAYTFTMISYYSTFSLITETKNERVRLSSFKAFFDVIGYSIAYALIPAFLNNSFNIRSVVYILIPLMVTMLIPLFVLKDEDETEERTERVKLWQQIKTAFSNIDFRKYLIVLLVIHMGLQLFLVSQNVIASGVLQLNTWQTALLNTAAFAPVPLMLILFNYVQKEKGLRYSYRTALLAFGIGIMFFAAGSEVFFPGAASVYTRLSIGIFGGIVASYAIGPLFSFTYLMPTQLAATEMEKTGVNNTSMYFAVQGLVTQLASALATGVIYIQIKKINLGFINLSVEGSNGIFLVPFLVLTFMLISFVLTKLLPSSFEKDSEVDSSIPRRTMLRMILEALYSGTLALLIYPFLHVYETNKLLKNGKKLTLDIILSILTAGLYILFMYIIHSKDIKQATNKNRTVLLIVLTLLLVGVIVNPFIIQNDLNKVSKA